MIGILSYTVIYQVFFLQGYLVLEPVIGSVRATVEAARTTAPIATLPYCEQPNQLRLPGIIQLGCVTFEPLAESLLTPDIGILVGTRLSTTIQHKNAACSEYAYGCDQWLPQLTEAARIDEFVGNIDLATVYIQHSVEPAGGLRTVTSDKELVDTFSPPSQRVVKLEGKGTSDGPTKLTGGDVFTLKQLLDAAAVELDQATNNTISTTDPFNVTTPRYSGTTVRVMIEYNSQGYVYKVEETLVQSKRETVRWQNFTHRQVDDIHGIQFIFSQTSNVYKFDVRTLLLTLVSGFALLSAARTVADMFVLYVSPHREAYKLFVQKTTPDFDPDSEAERALLAKVLARKRFKRDNLLSDEPTCHDGPGACSTRLLDHAH
mmetsp:Transcript_3248/g.6898  ORF Transcript_3248/g.6898 Transcript_3248/m.6898 type:complete len:375 (+) Transcript_3248:1-1125(+)